MAKPNKNAPKQNEAEESKDIFDELAETEADAEIVDAKPEAKKAKSKVNLEDVAPKYRKFL